MAKNSWRISLPLAMMTAAFATTPASAVDWDGKQVNNLFMDTRTCVFFQLDGVPQADPAAPGVPWFALDKGNANFSVMYSMLLAARAGGTPMRVKTNGTLSCGFAAANSLGLYP